MRLYYDGTKLLSLMDIDGLKPEIYICTGNRTSGKTTYFNRLMVNRFLNKNSKFGLIYRYNYELQDIGDKFFKDIKGLFFPEYNMISKPRLNNVYQDLYLNEKHCGYAISLNNANQIKKISHIFNDVDSLLFDEFQSETNRYCDNEMNKFISIHTSIARGNGKQTRYVPVYMLSNNVSLINPYYTELNISHKLTAKTKFLRGKGFVLEQNYNQSASEQQKMSGFNKAFESSSYTNYSQEGVYLNDEMAFIENVKGQSFYICTLKYNNREYAIREYPKQGIVYCDQNIDVTNKRKITVTTADHTVNYVMLKNNSLLISNLRYYFEHGCCRFKNIDCKEALIKAISY